MRFLLSMLALLVLVACGSDNTQTEDTSDEQSATSAENQSTTGVINSPSGKYTLTPMLPSPSYPDAKIESMSYANGKWSFDLSGDSYKLGEQTSDAPGKGCANSAQGQHIHLIIDNEPYLAKYESEFEHQMADGKHVVLAFLSRSYHESIKSEGAAVTQVLLVQDNQVQRAVPHPAPAVFYSRPKGVYEGDDTKRVMLDYYLANTNDSHYVKADINGEVFDLDEWQPYIIEGLPAGDNTITLTLMDENGPVGTVMNPVSRTFKINP